MAMTAFARAQEPYWRHLPGRTETVRVVAIALALGIATGLVFSIWPRLDIAIAAMFQGHDGVFHMVRPAFWPFVREMFLTGFTLWYVTIVVGCVLAAFRLRELFDFDLRKWLYLASCSIVGPLLLVNVVLKEHWGRWRPREVIELGGAEIFTRPLELGGTCDYNCSFVSGEVSSMVMVFISLAFVTTAWRPVFYVLTIALGLLSAAIRVGQGGHFPSDTLFAGVFMVIVAAAVYWPLYLADRQAPPDRPNGLWALVVARHDALWERLCDRGLALLDRLFPRVR